MRREFTLAQSSDKPIRAKWEFFWFAILFGLFVVEIYADVRVFWPAASANPALVSAKAVELGAAKSAPLFLPTVPNAIELSAAAPAGMAWIPGGEFSMGANDPPDMDEVGMKALKMRVPS